MVSKKIFFIFIAFLYLLNIVWSESVLATTKITYADTILAKVVSEIYGYPQILLERDKLSNETIELLKSLNVSEIIIIGGPAVVSPNVEEELKKLGYKVIRIWGVERYETSALVAKYFWDFSEEVVLLTEDLAHERANFRIISLVRDAVDFAIDKKIPILITPVGNLEKNVIDAIISLGVKKTYIFTLARNLSNILNELKELNVTYEIFRVSPPKNCTPIRIGVLENELWNLSQEVLFYRKCVEIVPIRENLTLDEIRNLNLSIVITNLTTAKEFRERLVYREMLKIRAEIEERLSLVIRKRLYDMLIDITTRLNNVSEEVKKCYLEIRSNISKIDEENYEKILDCLSKINEYRWRTRLFVQDFKKQKIVEIKNNLTLNYISLILDLNLSREMDIFEDGPRRWMPDPLEIRERLHNVILNRIINRKMEGKLCIQVITCACSPFGECRAFPTPCNVPPLWKVVSCEEINRAEGKIRIASNNK